MVLAGLKNENERNFPGGPVVKTSYFQCRGCRFNPWLGNQDPACCILEPKIKGTKKKKNERDL